MLLSHTQLKVIHKISNLVACVHPNDYIDYFTILALPSLIRVHLIYLPTGF